MITGKDSWKFLVMAFIVLVITCGAGCCAYAYGGAGKVFGVLCMLLGITWTIRTYLKLRDK